MALKIAVKVFKQKNKKQCVKQKVTQIKLFVKCEKETTKYTNSQGYKKLVSLRKLKSIK